VTERDDIAEYCRRVEQHLTRVNGGHLVRVIGPGFELVRSWAESGVPLSVVFRGIETKAERHAAGSAKRPLRIEFCAGDVRDIFEGWRRAIGLPAEVAPTGDGETGPESESEPPARRPSLSRHLERAIERLVRVAGRLDVPEGLRAAVAAVVERLATLREAAHGARGDARDRLAGELRPFDGVLLAAARAATPAEVLAALERDAAAELAPFQGRLAGADWTRSLEITVDRLLRDRYGLPTVEL
jgi:hypothetical protein